MFFVDVFLWILSYNNEYIDDDDFGTYTDDDRDLSDFLLFVPHYSCRRLRMNKNREEEKIKFLPNLGGMFSKSYPLPRTNGNCLLRRSKSGANPHSIFGKCTIFKSVRDTSLPDLLCLNCVFQIQLLKSTVTEYALQRNTLIKRVIQDNWDAKRNTCSILQLLVGTLTTV